MSHCAKSKCDFIGHKQTEPLPNYRWEGALSDKNLTFETASIN
jgi:hypothetical protein